MNIKNIWVATTKFPNVEIWGNHHPLLKPCHSNSRRPSPQNVTFPKKSPQSPYLHHTSMEPFSITDWILDASGFRVGFFFSVVVFERLLCEGSQQSVGFWGEKLVFFFYGWIFGEVQDHVQICLVMVNFGTLFQKYLEGCRYVLILSCWVNTLGKKVTLPETNIAPKNGPSQKEIHLRTIHFQMLC